MWAAGWACGVGRFGGKLRVASTDRLCGGRRYGHSRRRCFPHEGDFRRGQGVGLVDEVAEGAPHGQGFSRGGAGGGGQAEKLKLGKQKAEIPSRTVRPPAAAACPGCRSLHLPVKKIVICGANSVSAQPEGASPLTRANSVRRKPDILMDRALSGASSALLPHSK